MKNFVFISPNFPVGYWKFCEELKKNGLRVLGIGDCPYFELKQELREALTEYYKVGNLENYDEVFRAVAFFTYKYGKIDWLESNNEYWLERDARLRQEFHITTGFQPEDMERIKRKSTMKQYYAKAGIPTARFHLVDGWEDTLAFAHQVGYPVVVKPDNGVGASHTYRISGDQDLERFFREKDGNLYIMEELVDGTVQTFDGIIDSKGEPLFFTGNVTAQSLMDVINSQEDLSFYIVRELPAKLEEAGRKTVKAFNVRSRFVHLEFFVLNRDQEGLGKKGDVVGLEVNMRPSGGVSPDMMDYAHSTDVYKIWADMVAFDRSTLPDSGKHQFCVYAARRDGRNYALTHGQILEKYGSSIKQAERVPDALAALMANQFYIATVDTFEQMQTFIRDVLAQQ